MTIFYAYSHHLPDGTPFYVGKGCGDRFGITRGKRCEEHKEILKLYGADNVQVKVYPCATEEESFLEEERLISEFRAEGHKLVNKSGGRGTLGITPSVSTREKIRLAGMNRKPTEETKLKLSEAKKGNTYLQGYRHTKEARQKISETKKEWWVTRKGEAG